MIRAITFDEVPLLVPFAAAFFEEQKLPGKVVPEVFVSNWQKWIQLNMGIVLGSFNDDTLTGTIGGIVYPDPNDGETVAGEMFWYVPPEKRAGSEGIRLFTEFEKTAKSQGAKRITMIHLERNNGKILGAFYRKRGYRPIETHYIKEL